MERRHRETEREREKSADHVISVGFHYYTGDLHVLSFFFCFTQNPTVARHYVINLTTVRDIVSERRAHLAKR